MKNFLVLLFLAHPVFAMYSDLVFSNNSRPDKNESLHYFFGRMIKSLHDEHIRIFMNKYPYHKNSQIFEHCIYLYARMALENHKYRSRGQSYLDVSRATLHECSLKWEDTQFILDLMVGNERGSSEEIERKKRTCYNHLPQELAFRSQQMMKMLDE